METFKIRVKVGTHEFEAEGSQQAVERQVRDGDLTPALAAQQLLDAADMQ